MMSETVVTVDGSTNNTNNNPRQGPTVKTDPGQPSLFGEITLNLPYFKTIPGMIKLAQLIIGIVCMACASPAEYGASRWFMFVVVVSFITTLLWVFVYMLSLREALKIPINWIYTELLNTGIDCALYFIVFIVQLAVWSSFDRRHPDRGSQIAAGVFGLFNTIAYGAGLFFLWIEWKNSQSQ